MPANVVLVTIDSLRADRLSCYGYHKPTSPRLDALARESVRFENAFAAGIPTMPSFTTLMSGMHPLSHGVTAHASDQRLAPEVELLAQHFKNLGYATAAVDNLATQSHGRGSWFARGFDYYSSFLYAPFSEQSAQLIDRAISFAQQLRERPFLLWIHLWDPHTPYSPPPPFDALHYAPGESGKSLREATASAPEYYAEFLRDMKLQRQDDYDWISAQYDGEVSYADSQAGRLFDALKALGLWDDTHVVALADHGEAFGEGGVEFDHHGLFDAVTRIPLIWKPAREFCDSPPSTCSALVSHEDILPTLLEACGDENALAPDGITVSSFAPALQGYKFPERQQIVMVESTRQCSIALRTREWKLIVPIVKTSDGRALPDIYGRPRDASLLLFDLKNDPGETRNVARDFPEVRDALARKIADARSQERARSGVDPLDYGLSLGYSEFMARLTSRQLRSG